MRKIYCLKCKKHNGNKNPKVTHAFNGKIMFSPVCAVCNKKKNEFIKKTRSLRISKFVRWNSNSLSIINIINI